MPDLITPTVPVDLIHVHHNNVRRSAVADEEMVDSIRSLGIAQALTVMPHIGDCPLHPECWTLGAGHRRLDGAVKAGLDTVPVMVRDDLVTDAQQLEFMLVENLHRSDLTAVEEAEAYEQLTFAGMDAAAIAKATGRKVATVKARLKLNGLAEGSRERLHAGEMTLMDAESLLEFADDAEATAELEKVIGTPNFQHRVHLIRDRRKREVEKAAKVAEFEAAGAARATTVPGMPGSVLVGGHEYRARGLHMFPEDQRAPATHAGCLAVVVPDYEWSDPYLVCIDTARHPQPEKVDSPPAHEQRQTEWEKTRAEQAERAARRAAASAARVGWLRDHFTGLFAGRAAAPLAAAAKAFIPVALVDSRWDEVVTPEHLLPAMGLEVLQTAEGGRDYAGNEVAREAYASGLTGAKSAKVMEAFGGWLAGLVADQLGQDMQWTDDDALVLHQLALWDWLKAAGYRLSDVDVEIRRELEVKHTELADDALSVS